MIGSSACSGAIGNTNSACSVAATSTAPRLEQLEREHIVEECSHFALSHFEGGGSAHALVKPLARSNATGTADSRVELACFRSALAWPESPLGSVHRLCQQLHPRSACCLSGDLDEIACSANPLPHVDCSSFLSSKRYILKIRANKLICDYFIFD